MNIHSSTSSPAGDTGAFLSIALENHAEMLGEAAGEVFGVVETHFKRYLGDVHRFRVAVPLL